MAPGQYDNPLADFLDNLPGYINQFQQNQLALERQQLQEKRYQDSIARQNRIDAENQKRYETEQKRLDDQVERDELNRLRGIGRSFINSGDTEQAIRIFEKTGDMDLVSGLRSKAEKETGREDGFVELRGMAGRSDTNPFEYRDKLKAFRERYDIRPGDNSSLDSQLFQIESRNNAEIKYRNRGSVPPQEWESRFGASGRMDYNALKNAEKNLEDLAEEQASPSSAITSGIGGATLEERIEAEQKIIQEILNQPKYKLETEAEYRARKESEKQVSSVLQKANMARAQGLSFPNIGLGETTFDIVTPTEENFAQINDEVSKNLDKVFSDPKEPYEAGAMEPATEAVPGLSDQEKIELGMPMINLPSATAGQQGSPAPAPVDTTLNLGENISAPIQEAGSFDVKDISEASNYLKNPLTGRRYAKDLNKLNNLINRMREADSSPNPDFTKKQIQKGIDKISNKIKKAYGEFIDPNTGNFTDESFTDKFYSNLATPSGISKERLKQIFKALSTAPQSKTEV
jgi:hypothetical protein